MHEWFLYLVVGTLGALIGSFLNVCIFRLPRGESIAWPGSHCPSCAHPIEFYDNIPLLSYLWLGGRCRAIDSPRGSLKMQTLRKLPISAPRAPTTR